MRNILLNDVFERTYSIVSEALWDKVGQQAAHLRLD